MAAVTASAACCASKILSAKAVTHKTRPPSVTTDCSSLGLIVVPAWNTFTDLLASVLSAGNPVIESPLEEVSG